MKSKGVLTKMKKKIGVFIVLVLSIVLFSACGTTELEERSFPLLVTIGYDDGKFSYGTAFPKENATGQSNTKEGTIQTTLARGKSFEESKIKYENRLNKEVDYNHLKILVLEDDILENQTIYYEVMDHLIATEEFPRNTYVCVVEDVDDIYELEKNVSQDIGTYLEEYLKKQEEKKASLLTLGDLIDEKQNQTMVLYLPYFDVEEKFIEWKGYMNTSGKSWQESY